MNLEKKGTFQAFAFHAIVAFLVLAPVLVFGYAFASADTIQGIYPVLAFWQRSLAAGRLPLWSASVFSGFPPFVLGSFFNPFFVLLRFFSVVSLYAWLTWLNVALAGFFAYLFLRRLEFSPWACLFGGLVWQFACWPWAADVSLASILPAVPLLFLLAHGQPKGRDILFGGLLIGYLFYAANFNLLPILFAGVGCYALFNGWQRQRIGPAAAGFAAMLAIGIALGLPQLVPTFVYSGLSARSGGLGYGFASIGALVPGDIMKFFLPYAQLPAGLSSNHFYFAVLPLLCLLVGIFARPAEQFKHLRWFFIGMLCVSLLIAVTHSPVYWLLTRLPVLSSLRDPGRWLLLGWFAASVLAALGLGRVVDLDEPELRRYILRPLTIMLIVGFTLLLITTAGFRLFNRQLVGAADAYFVTHVYARTAHLPIEHYYAVIAQEFSQAARSFDLLDYHVFLSVAFSAVGLYLLYRLARWRMAPELFVSAATLLTAANFIAVWAPYHPLVTKAAVTADSPMTAYLRQHPAKYLTFLPGFTEFDLLTTPHDPQPRATAAFQHSLLPPNFSMFYNLSGADYYNNLMSRRMSRLLALVGSDRATVGDKLSDAKASTDQKIAAFAARKPLLDLLGIRYIISGYPLPAPFQLVFTESPTQFAIPVYLYENSGANADAWLADTTNVIAPSESAAYAAVTDSPPSGQDAVIECTGICPNTAGRAAGAVAAEDSREGRLRMRVTTAGGRWLVVSQNNLPGWQASIDGSLAPLATADSVFLAVYVPTGEHEVAFDFHYPFRRP